MVNRRRPREPTRLDRPITRSITRQAEERARQKPRLSDFGHEYKITPPRKTLRGNTHDELPHKPRGLSLSTSNDVMTKAPTTIDTQSRARTNHNHRDIIHAQNKIKKT